jgi:hypothetical protein
MEFFTSEEFVSKYTEYESIPTNTIMEASEMIFAQVSPLYRNNLWNDTNVPEAVKNASMEQARFLLAYEIPHIDTNELKAGNMQTKLKTEYSTLALTILANAGFLYRGNPINQNMSLGIEFGGE